MVFESAVEGFFLNHSDFHGKLEDLTNIPQGPTGLEAWPDILVRLTRAPVVSIALIRGRATGNGSEIALACDMSFASREKAVLSQWEVGVGLVAGGGPMARLPRLMGRGRALEVLLGSDDIGGELAEAYGYVNRSLPDAELDGFVDALATRIASFDKWAIANTKRLVNAASLPPDVEIAAGWDACMASIARPAAQERIKALLERGFTSPETRKIVWDFTWATRALRGRRRRRGASPSFSYPPPKKDKSPWICSPSRRMIAERVEAASVAHQSAGRSLRRRRSRQRHPSAPHERSVRFLDRARRSEKPTRLHSWECERPTFFRWCSRAAALSAQYGLRGRFCAMGGGVPLTSEGQLVAGVGVSGGTVEQDVAIVEAALR